MPWERCWISTCFKFPTISGMKAHIMGLLKQGLSLIQVMIHHKAHVREMALKNEHVTQDTFVL
jgi:hypothetical protein